MLITFQSFWLLSSLKHCPYLDARYDLFQFGFGQEIGGFGRLRLQLLDHGND